jgi:hypothetical protein
MSIDNLCHLTARLKTNIFSFQYVDVYEYPRPVYMPYIIPGTDQFIPSQQSHVPLNTFPRHGQSTPGPSGPTPPSFIQGSPTPATAVSGVPQQVVAMQPPTGNANPPGDPPQHSQTQQQLGTVSAFGYFSPPASPHIFQPGASNPINHPSGTMLNYSVEASAHHSSSTMPNPPQSAHFSSSAGQVVHSHGGGGAPVHLSVPVPFYYMTYGPSGEGPYLVPMWQAAQGGEYVTYPLMT